MSSFERQNINLVVWIHWWPWNERNRKFLNCIIWMREIDLIFIVFTTNIFGLFSYWFFCPVRYLICNTITQYPFIWFNDKKKRDTGLKKCQQKLEKRGNIKKDGWYHINVFQMKRYSFKFKNKTEMRLIAIEMARIEFPI